MTPYTEADRALLLALGRLVSEYVEGEALPTERLEALGGAVHVAFEAVETAPHSTEAACDKCGATWNPVTDRHFCGLRELFHEPRATEATEELAPEQQIVEQIRRACYRWDSSDAALVVSAVESLAAELAVVTRERNALRELSHSKAALQAAQNEFTGQGRDYFVPSTTLLSRALRAAVAAALAPGGQEGAGNPGGVSAESRRK